MRVAKWGNSLAVRLPRAVVEALEPHEGDEIKIAVAGPRRFEVGRDRSREAALATLRALRRRSKGYQQLRGGLEAGSGIEPLYEDLQSSA